MNKLKLKVYKEESNELYPRQTTIGVVSDSVGIPEIIKTENVLYEQEFSFDPGRGDAYSNANAEEKQVGWLKSLILFLNSGVELSIVESLNMEIRDSIKGVYEMLAAQNRLEAKLAKIKSRKKKKKRGD